MSETQSDLTPLLDAVHCMDNCKGMMLLPDESIDLVVTSPPYDGLREYGGFAWDFDSLAVEIVRVLKPGGVLVWNVADQTKNGDESCESFRQAIKFKECGLLLADTMIYYKSDLSILLNGHRKYCNAFEYMFVFSKGKIATFNPIFDRVVKSDGYQSGGGLRKPDGTLGKEYKKVKANKLGVRSNVWAYSTGKGKTTKDDYAFQHPALMPEKMAMDHILTWSNKGDIVLDPFMGSGTTAKAAQELGRHYIGFEINPEYVEICQRRAAQAALDI